MGNFGTWKPAKLESRNEPYIYIHIYIYDILGCGSMHGRVLVFGSWSLPLVPWLLVLAPWLLASGVPTFGYTLLQISVRMLPTATVLS